MARKAEMPSEEEIAARREAGKRLLEAALDQAIKVPIEIRPYTILEKIPLEIIQKYLETKGKRVI